ncbi:hypothetical protein K3495_g3576 [Podosphaera aphanis]|nr:hypothetical protein K3495_g3576 [Podosphaera aphanis]
MVFSSFANKASSWSNRIRLPHTKPGEVKVHWIPSHAGIQGNTLVDTAAKEALSMPPPISFSLSLDTAKAWIKKSSSGGRLSLRLDKDHDWRHFSLAGIQEAATKHLGLPPTTIEHVYRVPTGFAIKAKGEETRQSLLDSAEDFTPLGAKLEQASDLVVLRFSAVPVALNTAIGRVTVTEELIRDEIIRNTDITPLKVRPHGKSRLRVPHQTWLAYFERFSAPRPGFRLFDESGVAVRHQPERTVQQCKRCLEFHRTRGCSRAPAFWSCSSKMHSTSEYKARIKCRNCGRPHRSDSRSCLARPTRSGPVTKEQLVTIPQASQREFAAVARAKAAIRRSEAAASAIKRKQPAHQQSRPPISLRLTRKIQHCLT